MAMNEREIFGSQQGTDADDARSTDSLHWIIDGSNDKATVVTHALTFVPSTWRGLIYDSLALEQIGPLHWLAVASYIDVEKQERDHKLEIDEYRVKFSTQGATIKAYQAAVTKYAPAGETAPDFEGAIGVDNDNKVAGVDVGTPSLKFSITYKKAKAAITWTYIKLLRDLTYHYNVATFFGFAAGEVLFTGADGSQTLYADAEVTYNFVAEPNITGLTVGSITGIAKLGHEYIWPWYRKEIDTAADVMIPRPGAVYVSKPFSSADFDDLGIGGGP